MVAFKKLFLGKRLMSVDIIIRSIVNRVSFEALKQWLRETKRKHSFANKQLLLDFLLEKVNDSNEGIKFEELLNVALGIEENGSKDIYLYQLSDISHLRDKHKFQAYLDLRKLKIAEKPVWTIQNPKKPTINYILWSEVGIRVKWSEKQYRMGKINYETQTFEKEPVTKVVVLIVDFEDRLVRIQIDEPTRMHDHRDIETNKMSNAVYRTYYLREIVNLLNITELNKYELLSAATTLVSPKSNIIRLVNDHKITGRNSSFRFSCKLSLDIRKDPAYKAALQVDENNNTTDDAFFYWLPEHSNNLITREVPMKLDRKSNMIKFHTNCLETEVNYALSRIREVQKPKS